MPHTVSIRQHHQAQLEVQGEAWLPPVPCILSSVQLYSSE